VPNTHCAFSEIEKKFIEPLYGEIVDRNTDWTDHYVQVWMRNYRHNEQKLLQHPTTTTTTTTTQTDTMDTCYCYYYY